MKSNNRILTALAQIAEIASTVTDGDLYEDEGHEGNGEDQPASDEMPSCVIKSLPKRLLVKAAETARTINPVNAPAFAALGEGFQVADPFRIAMLTSKYWGPAQRKLSVSFMESTPADLKARILGHMNAWNKICGISFAATNGIGDVRISRQPGGYWSYLGTDIQHIPKNRQTMNLEGFTMATPESEYRRVVRHETGHTLGFVHEHMRRSLVARIDPPKAYKWFLETQGWDKATVDAQVLTALNEVSLMSTPPDETSIMCYQLPGKITKNGKPIPGGIDINPSDYAFAGKVYPKANHVTAHTAAHAAPAMQEDWAEAEDVEVPA